MFKCMSLLLEMLKPPSFPGALVKSNLVIKERLAAATQLSFSPSFSFEQLSGRFIALDTEGTGCGASHSLTEIGCVEMVGLTVTGRQFQAYVDPGCEVSHGAHKITGHTWKFLRQYPPFNQDIAERFLRFIKNSPLIIHDARSDLDLLNESLELCGQSYGKLEENHKIIDTLPLAQCLHPGMKNNLTALCERYGIDTSVRYKHGALIDAKLLAQVFCAMVHKKFGMSVAPQKTSNSAFYTSVVRYSTRKPKSLPEGQAGIRVIYSAKNPECDIRGVSVAQLFSLLERLRKSGVADHLDIIQKSSNLNSEEFISCSIRACLTFDKLIDMPLSLATKTIMILIPEDNDDMHRMLIDAVNHFLDQKLTVKIILPLAKQTKGNPATCDPLCDTIPISSKSDLEPATEPLHLQLSYLKLKNKSQNMETAFVLGKVCFQLKRYEEAYNHYKSALREQIKSYEDKINVLQIQTFISMGDVHVQLGNYAIALACYKESARIKKHLQHYVIQDHLEKAQTLHSIGTIYFKQQNYPEALSYYRRSLVALKFAPVRSTMSTDILVQIGKIYFRQMNYPLALRYYFHSFNVDKTLCSIKVLQLLIQRAAIISEAVYTMEDAPDFDPTVPIIYRKSL